jgi:hypothetical protein
MDNYGLEHRGAAILNTIYMTLLKLTPGILVHPVRPCDSIIMVASL